MQDALAHLNAARDSIAAASALIRQEHDARSDKFVTVDQWDKIAKCEEVLYKDRGGVHPYTEVNYRAESRLVWELWQHAEGNDINIVTGEDLPVVGTEPRDWDIARRVARALAVSFMGAEFLLA